jgi:hypothetical protein
MFASLISRLPAPLRRAVAYAKAFAFLEEPPTALVRARSERSRSAVPVLPAVAHPGPACRTDRRRRAPGARPPVSLTRQLRSCGTEVPHARRSGAVARPKQLCRTPTNGRPVGPPSQVHGDRRAAVAGGFLHR